MIKSDVNILFNHKNSEASMAMGGSSSEKTLFHRMVESGSLKALEILKEFSLPSHFRLTCNIEYKINEGDQKGELRGITALYLAVDKQKTEMVEFLVERSNLNAIVTKHQNDESELKEFSILEIALKKAESDKGLKILKILTGENKTNKKAPLFRYEIGDERRKIELEKITKKCLNHSDAVIAVLRRNYGLEFSEIDAEIKKIKSNKPNASPAPEDRGVPSANPNASNSTNPGRPSGGCIDV